MSFTNISSDSAMTDRNLFVFLTLSLLITVRPLLAKVSPPGIMNPTPISMTSLPTKTSREIDIHEHVIHLSNGNISSKVVVGIPTQEGGKDDILFSKPILIFLHGSFHSSWCYKENFIPYFVSLGYPVIAYSWRGTYDTPLPIDSNVKKVSVSQDCQDLDEVLQKHLPDLFGSKIWKSMKNKKATTTKKTTTAKPKATAKKTTTRKKSTTAKPKKS